MAKDGTNRGGRRPRAGREKDALVDKLAKGKPANVMKFPTMAPEMKELASSAGDFFLTEMPDPSSYLKAKQHDGKPFGADIIYEETVKWLRERHCADFINPRLIEAYADSFARFIQCSEAISEYGLIEKHPVTGNPIRSPFVAMSLQYQKQAQAMWYEIFSIVKENSLTPYDGNPQDEAMERLLTARKA